MASNTSVPFLNLRAQHDPIRAEVIAAISDVIDTNAFAGGPVVAQFEDEFAKFCDIKHAIGVGNGTDALWLALLSLGVGSGDEVITVPSTFMATAEAITYCGATPVFVDIEDQTYTMDPARLEAAITPRTKAIIPVHLFGQMADMDPIMEIARTRKIPVVEDACQAHGAEYKGRKAGTIGDAGCFSFYPGKNLGAMGEAGATITQRDDLNQTMRTLRDHGQTKKYHHDLIGWNARMDGIQAAVLRIKLRLLAKGNEARRQHADHYAHSLVNADELILPTIGSQRTHVFHIYALRLQDRDGLMKVLGERGIGCGIHYPIPVHLQAAYKHLGFGPGRFPVAERCAKEFVSLPMFPELTSAQVDTVAREVKAWLKAQKPEASFVAK